MIKAKPEHAVLYSDLCKLIAKHAETMSKLEVLAVAANMVGKLVAMQDQRVTTPKDAMDVVAKNLEIGNKEVLDMIMDSKGSS